MKSNHSYKEVLPLPLVGEFKDFKLFYKYSDFISYLINDYNTDDYIIGRGTNTLPIKRETRRRVIKVKEEIISIKDNKLFVSGNVLISKIHNEIKKHKAGNFIGVNTIPGSIGAAIRGNATYKTFDTYKGLEKIIVFNQDKFNLIDIQDIKRSYRSTNIKGVVVFAIYKLVYDYDEKLEKELILSRNSQPKGIYSLGSTFKNPSTIPAYKLIKEVIRKYKIKNYMSKEHYNFLDVHKGDDPEKIYRSLEEIRLKVHELFNIELEYEINLLK